MKVKLIDYGCVWKPSRKHYNDAGADIYCPTTVSLAPGETVKIPLKFGLEIPDGYFGLIYSRSSMTTRGLACEMPPIDSGYRGEIHAVITNHSRFPEMLEAGDRIGQLVIQPVVIADLVDELGDERGDGAFGSTGK